jgi:predicted O-linked N-acetylglucosamine transferase (SPINDLY family)
LNCPNEALKDAEFALSLGAPSATLLNNLGNALSKLGRNTQALSCYEEAVRLDPLSTDSLFNRSSALRGLNRYAEAAKCCEEVLRISPRHRHAFGQWFQLRMDDCDWRDYDVSLEGLRDCAAMGDGVVNPMTLLLLDSPQLQLTGAQRFAAEQWPWSGAEPLPQGTPLRDVQPRKAARRIRIAYLSADFREHPVSRLLVGVLERHDRGRFEVLGVSFAAAENNDFGRRVRSSFDRVIDVENRSDEDLAAMLRKLDVDIAVDLMGFTEGQRFGVFARRVAPVQVAFLGFAGTTGTPYLDYVIADSVALVPGEERFFTERVVRMPHCFLPNDDRRPIAAAPPRAQLGLPDAAVVFCAFANSCKINPPIFDIWMRVLHEVPQGILWLRAADPGPQANLLREAVRRGVDAKRLVFAPRVDEMAQHLARLSCADLFLDTTPYNAHSTGCDALWAGVPMVTCAGASFASRIAASALYAVGLPELATGSLEEYRKIILRLATEPDELRALRVRLDSARLESPLFQTSRYTAHLEQAFERMHECARHGAAPEPFSLAASLD